MSESLSEILMKQKTLLEEVMEMNGELDEEMDQMLQHYVEQSLQKVDSIVYKIEEIDSTERLLKEKIVKFQTAKKTCNTIRTRIKGYIKDIMKREDLKLLEGNDSTIKLHDGVYGVDVINENDIPLEYFNQKIEYVLDKRKLLKALKEGEIIEGAKLIKGKSLRIGVK